MKFSPRFCRKANITDVTSTVYPFFSRSPYFRGFRGCPSFRENNMTAKSANIINCRKERLPVTVRWEAMGNAYYSRFAIMYLIVVVYSISKVCKNRCDNYTKKVYARKFLH